MIRVILVCSLLLVAFLLYPTWVFSQPVSQIHTEIQRDNDGRWYIQKNTDRCYHLEAQPPYTLEQLRGKITGTNTGLEFDFLGRILFTLNKNVSEKLKENNIKEIKELLYQNGLALSSPDIQQTSTGWLLYDKNIRQTLVLTEKENGLEAQLRFDGILHYGFIENTAGYTHTHPMYFRNPVPIIAGKASIDISRMDGKNDMIDWKKNGFGMIGYRVVREDGQFLYDGKISFRGRGPFTVGSSIVAGPFLSCVEPTQIMLSLETNILASCQIRLTTKSNPSWEFSTNSVENYHHEIHITNLVADTMYDCSITVGDYTEYTSFKTSPAAGSRKAFLFGYGSDCRAGAGGGERSVEGVNAYVFKKSLALAAYKNVAFFQFTGDLATGYTTSPEYQQLMLQNWKRTVEPFARNFPIYVGMGNHEALLSVFDDKSGYGLQVDKLPFDKYSSESMFARNFVLPTNGPDSEDGAVYDPDPSCVDFPSYKENVYYYTYDNLAIIVLNSNYWYSPSLPRNKVSGNVHGYIMDQQLRWLEATLDKLQKDANIDAIFVTCHTPAFPNGGHKGDAMWYNGDNKVRAYISGKPAPKGIIERRDECIIALMKHNKVVGLLAGDEHNYNRMLVTKDLDLYPKDWKGPKITESEYFRPIWQITNGALGAPYASQEHVQWTKNVAYFTVQYSLIFIHVNGKKISVEVVNPETLVTMDSATLVE